MNTRKPAPRRRPVLVLFALAALGVPVALLGVCLIVAALVHVTLLPLQMEGIVLIYEVLLLFVGFAVGLGRHIESSRVIQPLLDWADRRLPGVLPDFEQSYRQDIIHRDRMFSVAGLPTRSSSALNLEEIFVEPDVVPSLDQLPAPDGALLASSVPSPAKSIWDYFASHQLLIVLGPPGSGKTTLLRDIALTLATREKWSGLSNLSSRLPVFLSLRQCADVLKTIPPLSLVEVIELALERQGGLLVPKAWVEHRLTHGRCLLLLDGLDELVPADLRRQMANWIQQQVVAYPKNRFIVTSRLAGYASHPLSQATVLQLQPFTVKHIEQFVRRWYLANVTALRPRGDARGKEHAEASASEFLDIVHHSPHLLSLAANPLLLTMMVTIHSSKASLPSKRVDLYDAICEVLLGRWQRAKSLSLEMNPQQTQSVLQAVAYQMMCEGQREISLSDALFAIAEPLQRVKPELSGESFLRIIEERSGLLLERAPGIYSFALLGLQEYLAALYVREHQLEHELAAHMGESWWHETIYQYADLSEGKLTVPVLSRAIECLQTVKQHPEQAFVRLDRLLRERAETALVWLSMVERPAELALLARGFAQLVGLEKKTSSLIQEIGEVLRLISPLQTRDESGREVVLHLELVLSCLTCQSLQKFASKITLRFLKPRKASDFMPEMAMFRQRLAALWEHAVKYHGRTDRREQDVLLLEMLRLLDRADQYAHQSLYPPYQYLAKQVCMHVREMIHTVQENQRGRVVLRAKLLAETYPSRAVVDVGLEISNEGDETAEQVTVSLGSSDDYQVVQVDPPVDHLLPGKRATWCCTLRLPQVRATRLVITLSYRQRDGDGVETTEFADVLTFFHHEDRFPFVAVEKNPYVTGNPLTTDDVFFGREQVIADLAGSLQGKYQDNPLVVYGQRRTGKTSLLYALKRRLSKAKYIPVFYNAEGVDSPLSLFWGLANQIYDACTEAGITLFQPTREQYAHYASTHFEHDFLRQVNRALGERRLLLMIDEFESLEEAVKDNLLPKTVFSLLRKTMQDQRQLSFIFCGTHQLQELTRQYWQIFFNAALPLRVTFLDDRATRALIQEPVRGHFTYDELALMRMWKLTGGHPYFTQLLCHSVVSLVNTQRRGYVTRNEIDEVMRRLIQGGNDHLDYIWNESGAVERAFLLALAEEITQQRRNEILWDQVEARLMERTPVEHALVDEARLALEKRELLVTEGFKVSFSMGLIPEWLTAHHTWSDIQRGKR
jgi:Cdc6-like AAA superfamily ATPase